MADIHDLYKPNSFKSKLEEKTTVQESKPEIHQVASSSARIRKKSPGKKFVESFIADDARDIKNYVIYDVLLPAVKNTIVDAITNSIQMIFWGETRRPNNSSRSGGRSYVSYGNFSSAAPVNRNINPRDRYSIDDIILDSRGEAEEVLSQLVDLINDYGRASVSDLYYMVGLPSNHTDQKWGWRDLSSAYVSRVRDGYILKLPRIVTID